MGGGGGGQGGCERRIEVFVKIQKKNLFWGGGRVGEFRVVVNEELKLLRGGEEGPGGGSGWWGSGWM